MVRCQLRFAEEGYAKLSGVQRFVPTMLVQAYRGRLTAYPFVHSRYFADNIRDDYANGQLDAQVETVLGEMKELAIYGV